MFEVNEFECPMKKRKEKYNITIKPIKGVITSNGGTAKPVQGVVTSYGGTFPVSKEHTPLPSPNSPPKSSDFSR